MILRNKKVIEKRGAISENRVSCPSGLASGSSQPEPGRVIETNRATVESLDFVSLNKQCGNGSNLNISKCKIVNCKMCTYLDPSDRCVSNVTHRFHDCINTSKTSINCKAVNVVYLLTCSNCCMQYVGETARNLNIRVREHLCTMMGNNSDKGNINMKGHFINGTCKDAELKVKILEKLEGNGRTERNAICKDNARFRRSREAHWIKEMRTVYPYGFNSHPDDKDKICISNRPIALQFQKLPKKFKKWIIVQATI